MSAARGAQKAPVTRRVKLSMVEITITGSNDGTNRAMETLAHCINLASQGKSATIKAPGIDATVKVTR